MVRPAKLSATFVKKTRSPGRYGEGRGSFGLSLLVTETATGKVGKYWSQRLRIYGRPFNVGLGSYPRVSLAEARRKAFENVQAIERGEDPREKNQVTPTLQEALDRTLELLKPRWKPGSKTEKTIRGILGRHVPPGLWIKPVSEVTPSDILAFLAPLAIDKPESARKVRVCLSQTFKWSVAQNLRSDDPTDERINKGLPKRAETKPHRALLPDDVPDAVAKIRRSKASVSVKLCFEFLVLTACRSGEVRGAKWEEIDLEKSLWTIPESRMKAGKEHQVPLSGAAVNVLREARNISERTELVFPSTKEDRSLSDATIGKLLRENEIPCVPHGFRQSFRNWCEEQGYDSNLAEMALAHSVGNKTTRAYLTTTAIERRRTLMADWARHVNQGEHKCRNPNQ